MSWRDSNPHRRNQNPTCYHYTTRQSCFNLSAAPLSRLVWLLSFDVCKGRDYF